MNQSKISYLEINLHYCVSIKDIEIIFINLTNNLNITNFAEKNIIEKD